MGPYALPRASTGPHATPLASDGPPAATLSSAGARVFVTAPEPRPVYWYRVSPNFSSIAAQMYVWAAALHHCSSPLSAVLPSGDHGAVADAVLPRRPRFCPSWRRLWPPRCYCARPLCFFWLFVLWVSQSKMSRGVVLYGHMQ